MWKIRFFAFAFTLIKILHSCKFSSATKMSQFSHFENKVEVEAVAESQIRFTRDLYVALTNGSNGNLFFSPLSITTALSMVYMGSKGNTALQMQSVLHIKEEKSSLRKAFRELIADLKTVRKEYELKTSNLAYISHKLNIVEDFLMTLMEDFLSSSKIVNFDEPELVQKEINGIVEKETNSKIKDLIPSGVLTPWTRMVLVNAIYFKGLWIHAFKQSDTINMPFWVSLDDSVDVQMMTVEKQFRIASKPELDAKLLALDYQGDRLSLMILLPNKKDGLAKLEEKLSTVDFEVLEQNMPSSKVKVYLPKFKLEETLDLVPILSKMGMSDLFSEKLADLSSISGQKDLFVSQVIHKAFLEVNEEGSEAAAATAVVAMTRAAIVRPTPPFQADHPFLFYVRDRSSNMVLFAGRFVTP